VPVRSDRGQVGARGLDEERLVTVAEDVGGFSLDGGIAPAVQHQPWLGAQQSRRVGAQREGLAPGGAVQVDEAASLGFAPE